MISNDQVQRLLSDEQWLQESFYIRFLNYNKNLHFLFSNIGQIPSSHFLTLFSKKHRYMLSSRYWGSSYKLAVRTEAYRSTRERLRIYQKKVLLQFSAASLYKRYLYNGTREVLGKCIPYANHSMRLIHAIYLSNKYSKKVLYCSTK